MAKATVKGAPAKAAAAKTDAKTDAKTETSKEVAVIHLNSKALSPEVGAVIVKAFHEAYTLDADIVKMKAKSEQNKHSVLASMTGAIIKAVNADDSINLADVFSGDQKKMNFLNDQLMIAMGIREQVNVAKDGKEPKYKIGYTKAVADVFPSAKDDKDSDEWKAKNNFRSNFAHQIKRASQAAYGAIEEGIEVKMDNKAGTLKLTGKAVQKHFGQESVLLNEKQTITVGTGDKAQKIKLAAKPSFTEIANIGAASAGKALKSRQDRSNNKTGTAAVDASDALSVIAGEFVKALNLFKGGANAKLKATLEKVQNGITVVLARPAPAAPEKATGKGKQTGAAPTAEAQL